MGRKPCCDKEGVNRGTWSVMEDQILANFIKVHGEGKWKDVPKRAGLNRCGKSCRLRWLNYLKPDIKRGNISEDEEELIIRLHNLLGNRWALIASRLPGRTDNEIKNFWKTNLSKRLLRQQQINQYTCNNKPSHIPTTTTTKSTTPTILSIAHTPSSAQATKTSSSCSEVNPPDFSQPHPVIRPKAKRCTKQVIVVHEANAAERGSQNNNDKAASALLNTRGEDDEKKEGLSGGSYDFLEGFDMDIDELLILPEVAQLPYTSFEKLQENVGVIEVNHTHQDWMVGGFFQPDHYDDVDFSFLDS